ncbi:hypothetical protein M3221_00420 [Domibacillus indicus]|uniref:hypothetical protein n=1 Tax=Domibacillus indicus TaxID=1437523 RepID=UPI00203FFDB6|nr:hypothetical protein [Domibacillus indicus]MCM3786894.1 hypothetical protein [Domibacillus indicus]
MSEFKKKIANYQQNGDETVIDDIMSAVEKDFMGNPTRTRIVDGTASGGVRISLNKNYEYIAYRIRAMRELLLRHVMVEFSDNINEFQRYLSIIYIDFGIQFKATIYDKDEFLYYFKLNSELFEGLEPLMPELEERFSVDEFRYFRWMFDKYKQLELQMRAERAERQREIHEISIGALKYALKYVDVNKSEKEIVKYVNMTFSSKLSDAEAKRNGLRRIQRQTFGKERSSYLVKPYFPKNIYHVIFGDDISDSLRYLNDAQREFIQEVYEIVEADKKAGNMDDYKCEIDGELRVSKKYIAEKLGIKESLVRKRFQRILEKIN